MVDISPDGSRVAYMDDEMQLFVRPLDQLEGIAGLGGARLVGNPFFSPDGAWIGYATSEDTSWKRASVLDGPPITLWDSPSAPRGASWGDDNTIVVGQEAPGSGLFRGHADGGDVEALTTPDESRGEQNHW